MSSGRWTRSGCSDVLFSFIADGKKIGKRKPHNRRSIPDDCRSSSDSSKISVEYLRNIKEQLRGHVNCQTTRDNYSGIWKNFNNFIISLDNIPATWEERLCMYCVFLIDVCKVKSTTLKSYVSAIKFTLQNFDDYTLNMDKIVLDSLTGACKAKNNVVFNRLPIQRSLLEQVLCEITRHYREKVQPYLEKMYVAAVILLYYGLLRLCEIAETKAGHALKAKDIFVGTNKQKILIILYSSKTHGKNKRPQQVRISPNANTTTVWSRNKLFCPFDACRQYSAVRGEYSEDDDNYFIYQDGSPLTPNKFRKVLKQALKQVGVDEDLYDTHSLRTGRATDLSKMGCSVEKIKQIGRWSSNAVYKYLRN